MTEIASVGIFLPFPEWWQDAKCKGMSHQRFIVPENETKKVKAARAICNNCPVRLDCLKWAIVTDSVGVFGGTTRSERDLLAPTLQSLYALSHTEQTLQEPKVPVSLRKGIPKPVEHPQHSTEHFVYTALVVEGRYTLVKQEVLEPLVSSVIP